jgi:hypothetical protein
VEDADEPVGEASQGVVMAVALGALLVVEGAGAGRGRSGRRRPGVERVDEPVVVHEPGRDDFPLPGPAGDGLVAA